MVDIRNKSVEEGDTVAAALREGNVAAMRVGKVLATWYGNVPNVEQTEKVQTAPAEQVLRVQWEYSSQPYLPIKPTLIAARKVLVIDRAD